MKIFCRLISLALVLLMVFAFSSCANDETANVLYNSWHKNTFFGGYMYSSGMLIDMETQEQIKLTRDVFDSYRKDSQRILGYYVDGDYIYYSSSSKQYVYNISTSKWIKKTWSGLTDFIGVYVHIGGNYMLNAKSPCNRIDNEIRGCRDNNIIILVLVLIPRINFIYLFIPKLLNYFFSFATGNVLHKGEELFHYISPIKEL